MTSRIRFTLARQVVEAFPATAEDLGEIPDLVTPLDHAAEMAALKNPGPAILFAALTLPKRESVWWGCICVRGMRLIDPKVQEGLVAAEAWAHNPEEDERRAAGLIAEAHNFTGPGAWIAFAAFTSGGSLSDAGLQAVPPPSDACARSVFAAIMQAVRDDNPHQRVNNTRCCMESFREFAEGGKGTSAWSAGPAVAEPMGKK
jgi:hypothetical protein